MKRQTKRTSGLSIPIPNAVVATTPRNPPADEVLLDARPLTGFESRVVVLHPQAVTAEGAGDALARVARARVDDRAAVRDRRQPLDENAQPILVAADLLDVVAEVRPHHARADDREVAAERGGDLRSGRGVAVAVIPSTAGSPSASSARRMKR